jgi:hypothetical protein
MSRAEEAADPVQDALGTTVDGAFGILFNVAGWYDVTSHQGTVVKVNAVAGMILPGRWTKAEAIATPGATTDLETVFLK